MEQPLITICLCYDCTNLHEPYDPPILVFCKFRFPRNPGGNELLLMPTSPVEFTSTGAEGLKFFNIL